MTKILIVEDDPDLLALVKYNLENRGFSVIGDQNGRGALELCRRERPALVILDIMLTDADGLEICKQIRQDPELAQTPIIFLTARGSETDRILGLELGANDYIVKPFSMGELVARVKVQVYRHAEPPRILRAEGLELDRSSRQVRLDGRLVSLTATEFRLLEFLMSRPGTVFSREQLLDLVWGPDRVVTNRTVDVFVLRLRHRLETGPGGRKYIRSVRGFGYAFQTSDGENDLAGGASERGSVGEAGRRR